MTDGPVGDRGARLDEAGAPDVGGESAGRVADPLPPHAEPVVTGTVFIMLVFLMALAGLWGIMYVVLLGR
ncbi:MAG TPA: hypothetical protein VK837_06350 [Longimicrobiales bacterium]|nr:hypothetical protein [Longimicrobiales bacterium]